MATAAEREEAYEARVKNFLEAETDPYRQHAIAFDNINSAYAASWIVQNSKGPSLSYAISKIRMTPELTRLLLKNPNVNASVIKDLLIFSSKGGFEQNLSLKTVLDILNEQPLTVEQVAGILSVPQTIEFDRASVYLRAKELCGLEGDFPNSWLDRIYSIGGK